MTTLLLAPVGAGKTDAALDRLLDATRARPFGCVWALLPSERQSEAFRRRMLAHDPARNVYFNVQLLTFYALYDWLLHGAHQGQRRLDDAARARLLRQVLLGLQRRDELRVFGAIADTPGFVRVVGEFLYELKQNLIYPDAFAQAAESDKDHDLARIYAAYQAVLQSNDLVDREGQGWLALEAVATHSTLAAEVDLLLVDGFDQFNLLQARLLAQLAGRAGATLATLTAAPGREATVGRRFERALDRLIRVHEDTGQALEIVRLEAERGSRPEALKYLSANLFVPLALPYETGGSVFFLEAPEPAQEAAAVLRRVKRLLLDGVSPGDILIAVRDWQTYAEPLATAATSYGLTTLLALQHTEPLPENPAIAALFDLLDLHAGDFRRRGLLDVLRSPYLELKGLDGEWVDHLERVSRALLVTGGRRAWLSAIQAAALTPLDTEDDTGETLLTPEASKSLVNSLSRFFDRVTPPHTAHVTAYIRWIEMLIGDDPERDPDDEETVIPADVATVNLIGRLRRPARPGLVERDLAAMAAFKDVLRALLSTQELFTALGADEQVTWGQFLAELKTAAASSHVRRAPSREGRVLVTTVTDARGLPHKHVFIPGLSEGVFPARLPEDPFYLDSEREALALRGQPLQTRSERADDDGLFYEMLSLARETLTLSRPYVKNGARWPESHLWRAAARLYTDSAHVIREHRLRVGAAVPADDAASLPEVALALADGLSAADLSAVGVYNWLLREQGDFWANIALGREIERRRMSGRAPYDHYSGRLRSPALVRQVAELLNPGKVWSATQLNDLGMCAFRYYAGRVLKLEALQEPEEGLTPLDTGTLYHAILERAYQQVAAAGMAITPDHSDDALAFLREAAREVFRDAPKRMGFQPSALWEQEKEMLLRRLEALVRDDFSGEGALERFGGEPRVPYLLEMPFGPGAGVGLTIPLEEVGTLRVRGKIDRIDRSGDKALIIDYKSGNQRIDTAELARGRNFQMMLYVLAAQEILRGDLDIEAGVFMHIGSRQLIGTLRLDEEGQDAMQSARGQLARQIAHARQGDFAPVASKIEEGKCARYCEYSMMCRMSIMSRRKAQS